MRKMTEVIPGIHQARLPIPDNPLEYTNVYLVQGDSGYLLIDAGWNSEEALQVLKNQMNEIGADLKDISQIVVTHAHGDHYGLAGKLRQLSRAKIALHYLEKDLIASQNIQDIDAGKLLQQMSQWFLSNGVPTDESPQLHMWTWRRAGFAPPAIPDITLRGGETIAAGVFSLQVVWTPGHSPGHICLYEPTQKILFSGDNVLPGITPNISLQPHSTTNPLGNFLNSLNLVKQLAVNLVLPAHEHLFTGLRKRVEEIVHHHEQRCLEILETIKAKPKTAYEISGGITWMPEFGGVSFQDLAPLERRMAVLEALAHLEAMRVEGRVNKLLRGDIIYYQHT